VVPLVGIQTQMMILPYVTDAYKMSKVPLRAVMYGVAYAGSLGMSVGAWECQHGHMFITSAAAPSPTTLQTLSHLAQLPLLHPHSGGTPVL
jgi:hypothetical protein